MLRDFTKKDWDGLAGAESCEDGSLPKIVDDLRVYLLGKEFNAIGVADRTHVEILLSSIDRSYVRTIPYDQGVRFLEWLIRKGAAISVERLVKIGFRRI